MRRGLSILALCLVLYTAVLTLSSFAICEASAVIDTLGEWATQGHSAHVRIEPCATTPETLCGIKWQDRLTPAWKCIGSGCHLNRPIRLLIESAGFHIAQIETGYMKGPKPMTFMHEGRAQLPRELL